MEVQGVWRKEFWEKLQKMIEVEVQASDEIDDGFEENHGFPTEWRPGDYRESIDRETLIDI